MVITASGKKSRPIAVALDHLEAEDIRVEVNGAIKIRDLEVNVTDTGLRGNLG